MQSIVCTTMHTQHVHFTCLKSPPWDFARLLPTKYVIYLSTRTYVTYILGWRNHVSSILPMMIHPRSSNVFSSHHDPAVCPSVRPVPVLFSGSFEICHFQTRRRIMRRVYSVLVRESRYKSRIQIGKSNWYILEHTIGPIIG